MPIEVEQKFRIDNPSELLVRLAELGAKSKRVVHQVDTYYAHPMRDFATTDEALRIRRVGESNFVTYKGPKFDALTKTRREIELSFASGADSADEFDELLQSLSFSQVAEVSKVRQIYQVQRDGQTIEVAVDEVQKVGDFVELEIVVTDNAGVEDAQHLIVSLAEELGLADAELRSYLELLLGE